MNLSKITDYLYVGKQPKNAGDYGVLHDLRIGLILNMRAKQGPYPDPLRDPIRTLWIPTYDNPLKPIPLDALLRGAREAIHHLVEENGRVYVHCAGGRRRSVAMSCCILIAMGYGAEQAMSLLKSQRPEADPDARHIKKKIFEFEARWKRVRDERQSGSVYQPKR